MRTRTKKILLGFGGIVFAYFGLYLASVRTTIRRLYEYILIRSQPTAHPKLGPYTCLMEHSLMEHQCRMAHVSLVSLTSNAEVLDYSFK